MNPTGIDTLSSLELELEVLEKGGAGSGNFGHRGRTGHEGGSVARGSITSPHLSADVVVFGKTPGGGTIDGIPIAHADPPEWGTIIDKITEPPTPSLGGMKLSAGVVVQEPDGRIWVVEPTNHFGGYEHTFAKGRVENGLTMQQTAMKEAYEEMGLNVQLTGYLRDAGGSTTVTRYYSAKRLSGDPADAHWETDKVKLATPISLKKMLNMSRDRETLSLVTGQKGGSGSGNFGHLGREGHEGGSVARGSGSLPHLDKNPDLEKMLSSFDPKVQREKGDAGFPQFIDVPSGRSPSGRWEEGNVLSLVHRGIDRDTAVELDDLLTNYGQNQSAQSEAMSRLEELATEDSSLGHAFRTHVATETALAEEYTKHLDEYQDLAQTQITERMVQYYGKDNVPPFEVDRRVHEWQAQSEYVYRRGNTDRPITSWSRDPLGANTGSSSNPNRIDPDRRLSWEEALRDYHVVGGFLKDMGAPGEKEVTLIKKSAFEEKKAALLSLPHSDGRDDFRASLEKKAEDRIYRAFNQARAEILSTRNLTVVKALRVLDRATPALRDALSEMFTTSTLAGAEAGQDQVAYLSGTGKAEVDFQTSWDLVHSDALNWAHRFTSRTLAGLNVTSGQAVSTAVEEWITNGLPLSSLDRSLASIFGRKRAKLIASTEVTRAFARGSIVAWKRSGYITRNEWATARDEHVCKVCSPLQGKTTSLERFFKDDNGHNTEIWTPPAHPGCRCYLIPIITEPDIPESFTGLVEETDEQRRDREEAEEFDRREAEINFWPSDPHQLTFVKTLGGSTGAELVRYDKTGQLFVRKHGASPEHLLEEVVADEMYRAAGLNVPKIRLYSGTGPHGEMTKLSVFIENAKSLGELKQSAPMRYTLAKLELRKGFVMDSALGNWDVIGKDEDNILVDASNQVWRIDNGGALRYRAMGTLKTKFSEIPTEIWSMRDPGLNPSAASIFKGMDYETEIIPQIQYIIDKGIDYDIREIPWKITGPGTNIADIDDLVQTIARRFYNLEEDVETFKTFRKDKWKGSYIDSFTKHLRMQEEANVFENASKSLGIRSSSLYTLEDSSGKSFDNLRGMTRESVSRKFQDYLGGTKAKLIHQWAGGQANSSWSDESVAVKYLMSESRDTDFKEYFWSKKSQASVKKLMDKVFLKWGTDEEEMLDAISAQHALTYKIFSSIDLPNVDRARGMIRQAIRTESWDVISKYGFPSIPDRVKRKIERGVLESGSLLMPFSYQGDLITVQEVPITRVIGSYLTSTLGGTGGMFAGDHENEILVLFENLFADYLGKKSQVTVKIQ